MNEWPLGEQEYEEIVKYFKRRCSLHIARPLVDFVQQNGLDWHDLAPESEGFNYASVHLWSTGARVPNREHICAIKQINGLSDEDVRIPKTSYVLERSKTETITWIQGQWFALPANSGELLSVAKVKALDIAVRLRERQMSREGLTDLVDIVEAIREAVPEAEVWTISDLHKLLAEWSHGHCGFHDAF